MDAYVLERAGLGQLAAVVAARVRTGCGRIIIPTIKDKIYERT